MLCTLAEFNEGLANASYVGPEILLQPERRQVNQFRAALVYVPAPEVGRDPRRVPGATRSRDHDDAPPA